MDKLEFIKLRMEENLNDLKEYQEKTLKQYEYLMGLNDIDEIDEGIQNMEWEFRFTTLFRDIECEEKRNMEELANLIWKSKTKGAESHA